MDESAVPAIKSVIRDARRSARNQQIEQVKLDRRVAQEVALNARRAESVMRAALRLAFAFTAEIRPEPGVYVLLDEIGEVVYVGQSESVAARLAGHADKNYSAVRMLPIEPPEKRLRAEADLIRALCPRLNRTLMPSNFGQTAAILDKSEIAVDSDSV